MAGSNLTWLMYVVVSSLSFEPDDLGSNPALSTKFNGVITVDKLLMYSCLTPQIYSSVAKRKQ